MSNTESAYMLWSEKANGLSDQCADDAVSALAQQMSDYYGEDPDINWEEIAQAFLE